MGVRIIQKEDKDFGENLLKKSDPVGLEEINTAPIKKILDDMFVALDSQKDGVALAAPQINILKRIFVISPRIIDEGLFDLYQIKIRGVKKFPLVFINPEIIKISKDKKKMEEGCLSVRPWYGVVKRASRATVKAINENGEEFEMDGQGLIAQIFQHEIDHLNGQLFIDKAKNLRKQFVDNEDKNV